MATPKRSKETNSDFMAKIWSAEHFNFKRYTMIRGDNLNKNDFQQKTTKLVNRTFSFKPVFNFWLLDLNI